MRGTICCAALLCFGCAIAPVRASAQTVGTEAPGGQVLAQPSPWRLLRVAKWAALTGAAGAAAYGFIYNGRADDRFRGLERQCEADPTLCRDRLSDGRYRDAGFEESYQQVLDLDRRSRTALIAGQLGIAASVVLFLLDLGNERRPPDIPYAPGKLEVGPGRRAPLEVRLVF